MAARRYEISLRDLLCSHSNDDIFTREDNILFSHVKIPSFRTKAQLVFHWCLYNKNIYYMESFLKLLFEQQSLSGGTSLITMYVPPNGKCQYLREN